MRIILWTLLRVAIQQKCKYSSKLHEMLKNRKPCFRSLYLQNDMEGLEFVESRTDLVCKGLNETCCTK